MEYPSWSELHYDRFNSLNQSEFFNHTDFGKLNRTIKNVMQTYNGAEGLDKIVTEISKAKKRNKVKFSDLSLDNYINKIPLLPNEFMTAFDVNRWNYIYVSDDVEHVLNLNKKDFNLESIIGFNPNIQLVHEEDVHHLMRYAICAYVFTSLYNYEHEPFCNTYEVFFRLKKIGESNYSVVHKKSFFNEIIDEKRGTASHVDIWNLSHKVQHFRKVSFAMNIPNNIKDTEIQNDIISLINAWILGFKTKEVFILSYLKKYQNVRLMLEKVNADLNTSAPYTLKSMNDFIYKLRKKIKSTYQKQVNFESLSGQLKFEITASRSLELCDKLGLFDFSEGFYNSMKARLLNQEERVSN